MSVFNLSTFILGKLLSDLAILDKLLGKFFQWRMGFQMRIWWFKYTFVVFIKIDWSFEDLILFSVELLHLRSVNHNFFNKNFSEIFEQLEFSLFTNNSSGFFKLLKSGLNTFIDSLFNGFIQKLSQLFFSQLVDVIESV